jgi:hypothetical protein
LHRVERRIDDDLKQFKRKWLYEVTNLTTKKKKKNKSK